MARSSAVSGSPRSTPSRRPSTGGPPARAYELQDPPTPGTADFARLVEALTIAPLRQEQQVTVLRNGAEIFPAMLEAIQQAKGRSTSPPTDVLDRLHRPEFAEALGERAEAGVEVNVLLDAVGAAKMDRSLIDQLKDAGAKVAWFEPTRWYTLHKLNNRTHRKILVIAAGSASPAGRDRRRKWTGNREDVEHWRDTHVRVEGPVGRDLLSGFVDNWAEATGCILSPPPSTSRTWVASTTASSPGHPLHRAEGQHRRRATVLHRDRVCPGADLADHRLLRATAGLRRRAVRRGRPRGGRAVALTNGPHTDKGSSARPGGAAMSRRWPAAGGSSSTSAPLHAKVLLWTPTGSRSDRSTSTLVRA